MGKRKTLPLRSTSQKLPATPKVGSVNRNYAAYAEQTFAESGYAGKSLLRNVFGQIRCRKPRGHCLLLALVDERQGAYAAMLGRIMEGSSLTASAVALGIGKATAAQWLATGLRDQAAGIDSYYSRFASDVYAATAHAVSRAEQTISIRNPLEYLRHGPGAAFYREERYWQEPIPGEQPIDDLNPLAVIGDGSQEQSALSDNRLSAALDVLKQGGLLDEHFTAALEQQGAVSTPSADASSSDEEFTVLDAPPSRPIEAGGASDRG